MSTLLKVVVVAGALLIGGIIGFVTTAYRYFSVYKGMSHAFATETLRYNIEIISRLRVGDTEGAIKALEMPLDNSIVNLGVECHQTSCEPALARLTRGEMSSLQLAKIYHEAYPSWVVRGDALMVLNAVSDPKGFGFKPFQILLQKARGAQEQTRIITQSDAPANGASPYR